MIKGGWLRGGRLPGEVAERRRGRLEEGGGSRLWGDVRIGNALKACPDIRLVRPDGLTAAAVTREQVRLNLSRDGGAVVGCGLHCRSLRGRLHLLSEQRALSLCLHDELGLRLQLSCAQCELLCLDLQGGIRLAVVLRRSTGLLTDGEDLEELLLLSLDVELGELLLLQLINHSGFLLSLDIRLYLLTRSSMRVGLPSLRQSASSKQIVHLCSPMPGQ